MYNKEFMPPKSWRNIQTHYLEIIDSNWYKLIIDLENLVTVETYNFYQEQNMKTMHLPVTTGTISSPMGRGSDSLPVKINLEGVDTYLADSMQFMLEYGCRLVNNGCFYIMPSFRGEKADERHLCQFYHSEAEIPGTLMDVMKLVEDYIKYLSKRILEKYGKNLKEILGDISHLEKVSSNEFEFKKFSFEEVERYFKENYPDEFIKYIQYNDGWRNITKEGEKKLVDDFEIVWITNYDAMTVPFYQALDPKDMSKALNADLLMGIGETVGCGQRHMTYNEVELSLINHGVSKDEYEWYLKMKKYYPMQTSGFGLGIERFLIWVLKGDDIRDFQICPRFNGENIMP